MLSNNQEAFLALVRAGLWEKEVRLTQYEPINYKEVYRLAQEHAVVGLVAAGLEHVVDIKVSTEDVLVLVGEALQLEQRNTAMNSFIAVLIEKMRNAEIYTLLIKGQGIAQCYERPLWRASGDVDLLLSDSNYELAKSFLMPLSVNKSLELKGEKHFKLTIETWSVELHGNLPTTVSSKIDRVINTIVQDTFYGGNVRSWINNDVYIFLPEENNDVILVFTHILKHLFYGGIGLRQFCDLCRLLWYYKESLDKTLLENRIKQMGVLSEWKSFAAFAVHTLGMPESVLPCYSDEPKWDKKANRLGSIILEYGNFGHSKECYSYRSRPFVIRKALSFCRNTRESMRLFRVFPYDTTRTWFRMVWFGTIAAFKKKR